MHQKKKKYLKEYEWSNIFAMMRNAKKDPKHCPDDFQGRLVVITGATSGIGYETARKFASRGAELLCINRNEEKSKALCQTLINEFQTTCNYLIGDFTRLADIHALGKKLSDLKRDIDVLIHNAGVFITKRTLTVDHLETVFQANYLSTFVLNYYLREKFKKQGHGRIIFVNSEAHRFAILGLDFNDLDWKKRRYLGLRSYGAAKTAQLLSMLKFAEYFSGSGVTINAMHPGNVKTNSGQNNGRIYKFFKPILVDRTAKSPKVSAEALYYLGVSSEVEHLSGKFFSLTTEELPAPPALDKEAAADLWKISLKLGGLN